jgi:peroxiredoxin
MPRVSLNVPAPDFELKNFKGELVHLSDYREKSNVLLVFNRGFT